MHVTWRNGKSTLALQFKPGCFVLGVVCFQDSDQHAHPVEKGLCVHRARVLNINLVLVPMVVLHLAWYHHETQEIVALPDMAGLMAQMTQTFTAPGSGASGFPGATTLN